MTFNGQRRGIRDHDVMKEDWRKSDSTTTSYYTVRPRSVASPGGTRTPRPVSMAESLHSTNTVVPAGKRLSALLTDAEFVMTEEDVSHSGVDTLEQKDIPFWIIEDVQEALDISLVYIAPAFHSGFLRRHLVLRAIQVDLVSSIDHRVTLPH
jgi:hypothetical protein